MYAVCSLFKLSLCMYQGFELGFSVSVMGTAILEMGASGTQVGGVHILQEEAGSERLFLASRREVWLAL